uniref:Peptidase S1 domain-containing protein n=1 Tax=Erpetoichthys calabaricus TaxID=27687 RepID=A0A8C4TIT9_ERPCA
MYVSGSLDLTPFLLCVILGVFAYKIIDGQEAVPHSRPYMAFLRIRTIRGNYTCGGALIDPNFVLTAAHCSGGFAQKHRRTITVYLGLHDRSKAELTEQVLQVEKEIPHEEYNEITDRNDIMLLKLERSVTLSPGVQIIGIPRKRSSTLDGTSCSVAGWGTTDNNGPSSMKLMEVNVTIQDVNTCTAAKINDLKETVICARGDGIKGTCSGDSGGPLVCSVKGRQPKAVGIVSFHLANNKRCKDPNRDNVYTKVSAFRDWIDRNIKANSPA